MPGETNAPEQENKQYKGQRGPSGAVGMGNGVDEYSRKARWKVGRLRREPTPQEQGVSMGKTEPSQRRKTGLALRQGESGHWVERMPLAAINADHARFLATMPLQQQG